MEQEATGTFAVWNHPFTALRMPKVFNLRTDPYERADITSNTYYDWLLDHLFLTLNASGIVGNYLQTFQEYPQRQKATSYNLNDIMEKMMQGKESD
jgi:arylsulfatase